MSADKRSCRIGEADYSCVVLCPRNTDFRETERRIRRRQIRNAVAVTFVIIVVIGAAAFRVLVT